MNEQEFKARTKSVALRVIKMTETLPSRRAGDVLARQLLRSATSVGANYRAACRSRSTADMISRLSIAEEEADESIYRIELLTDAGFVAQKKIVPLTRGNRRDPQNDRSFDQDAAPTVNPKSKI